MTCSLFFKVPFLHFILPQCLNQIELHQTKFLLLTVLSIHKEGCAQFKVFKKFIVIYQKFYNDFIYIYKFILADDMQLNKYQ